MREGGGGRERCCLLYVKGSVLFVQVTLWCRLPMWLCTPSDSGWRMKSMLKRWGIRAASVIRKGDIASLNKVSHLSFKTQPAVNIIQDEIKFIKLQVKVQFTDNGTCHFMFEEVCNKKMKSKEPVRRKLWRPGSTWGMQKTQPKTCSKFLITLSLLRRNLCQLWILSRWQDIFLSWKHMRHTKQQQPVPSFLLPWVFQEGTFASSEFLAEGKVIFCICGASLQTFMGGGGGVKESVCWTCWLLLWSGQNFCHVLWIRGW